MNKKDFGEFVYELFNGDRGRTPLTVLDKACIIFLDEGKCSERELVNELEIGEEDLKKHLEFLRENYLINTNPEFIAPTPIGIMVNSNIQSLQGVYDEHCNPPPKKSIERQAIASGEMPLGAIDFIVMLDMLIDEGLDFVDKQSQLKKTIGTFVLCLKESGKKDYKLIQEEAEEVMRLFTDISEYIDQITSKYAKISEKIRV